jgi:hypothetical protein
MKRVLSYSLWGSGEEYLAGALRAVSGARIWFPGWECRFHVREDVPAETLNALRGEGARVMIMPFDQAYSGMVLRFLPASDPEVDVFLSRDVDSPVTRREALAVEEWLRSDMDIHIIRDHPEHILPMMGGLWGARNGILSDMSELLARHRSFETYASDQRFLARHVYPKIWARAFVHSEAVRLPGETAHPFPSPRKGFEFIGCADRKGLEFDQEGALRKWLAVGSPMRTCPNIYSPAGRFWLTGRMGFRYLKRLIP